MISNVDATKPLNDQNFAEAMRQLSLPFAAVKVAGLG
jgi:hypothetical protein